MTLLQEIKPCPFCGTQANCRPVTPDKKNWIAHCNNSECGVEATTCAYPTCEAAMKRWNRRAFADRLEGAEMRIAWEKWAKEECRNIKVSPETWSFGWRSFKAALAVAIQQIKGE